MSSEVICSWTYDPSGPTLFKRDKNDRCSGFAIHCSNKDNCSLFKAGKCLKRNILPDRCPYGRLTEERGPTQRARGYYSSLQKLKEKYPYKPIANAPVKIAFIGDYVYLPYSFMDMCPGVGFIEKRTLFAGGAPFIRREEFNVGTVRELISFHPHALMGGEIKEYQEKSVPEFLTHLKELCPEIFNQLVLSDYLKAKITNIGRKAYVKTLNPGVIKVNRELWNWDGEKLTLEKDLLVGIGFDYVGKKFESSLLICVPSDSLAATIHDESQVNENTKFLN